MKLGNISLKLKITKYVTITTFDNLFVYLFIQLIYNLTRYLTITLADKKMQ